MDYLAWANKQFKKDIFARETTGIEIVAVDEEYAKCSLVLEKKHQNAANAVMGGVIFTLADFTFAVAANAGNPLTVSLCSQINFIAPAKGTILFAEAKCIKTGKTTCFYEVEVKDNSDNIVAIVTSTGFRKG